MANQSKCGPVRASRAAVAVIMAALLLLTWPGTGVTAAPGDVLPPIHADGDWWNYTVRAEHPMPLSMDGYDVNLNWSTGHLRYTVSGTEGVLGRVAWRMAVGGMMRLSGLWKDKSGSGDANLDATVGGVEWRSAADLAFLGSAVVLTGRLEIATMTGPVYYNVTVFENTTVNLPLRLMTFPIPLQTPPKERHVVDVTRTYEAGGHSQRRVEGWNYTLEYKGISDVLGSTITFVNQHQFRVIGNVTVDGKATKLAASLYFDAPTRKTVTVDGLRGMEVVDFMVDASAVDPDLVVIPIEFHAGNLTPREGTNVTFTAVVHNMGQRDVLQARVELWGAPSGGLQNQANFTTIERVPSNGKVTVAMNWTARELGEWTFTVRVDPFNYVQEEREYNNEATLALEVVRLYYQPNLYVSSDDLVLDPPSPVDNRTAVHITLSVLNQGPGNALNVTVDWYLGHPSLGGTPIGWRNTFEAIPSGRSAIAWINWVADVPGAHEVYAVVDKNNVVNETVETDNLAHTPVIIIASPAGGVDLVVVRVKLLDSVGQEATQLPARERATVSVLISNEGPQNATRVHLSVYVDIEDQAGLIGSYEGPITEHIPVEWSLPWTIAGNDGNHSIIANVVAIGQVEATFLDNTRTLKFAIGPRSTPPPETLTVTMFPDTTLLRPGGKVTVSGKVTRMTNGAEVADALVILTYKDGSLSASGRTNLVGRYTVSIGVPDEPGNYRLEVNVEEGHNTGTAYVLVNVEGTAPPPDGKVNKTDTGLTSTTFIVIAVVLASFVGPLAYVSLKALEARRARFRKVHEEVLEITERSDKGK
jgi:hypothetical protein